MIDACLPRYTNPHVTVEPDDRQKLVAAGVRSHFENGTYSHTAALNSRGNVLYKR
jgi:hypothetical protein